AAADQRRAVERDVGTDPYQRVLVHQHALGEGAQMRELRDRLAVLREPGRLLRAAHGRRALAEVRASGDAVLARAAEGREAADHVVAGRHVTHLAAHALDDARRLVPEYGRQRLRERSFEDVEVAVADPGRSGADEHLAWPRRIDPDVLDTERLADRAHHGRL